MSDLVLGQELVGMGVGVPRQSRSVSPGILAPAGAIGLPYRIREEVAQVRSYRGLTLREALARVRDDLGSSAVILKTQSVQRWNWLPPGRRRWVEVLASDQMPEPFAIRTDHGVGSKLEGQARSMSPVPEESWSRQNMGLSQRQASEPLNHLHATVASLNQSGHLDHLLPDLPRELVPSYALLVQREVPEGLASRLVGLVGEALEPQEWCDPQVIFEVLREAIEACIAVAPPSRSGSRGGLRLALVGPSGSGKTTTLAKLAAWFKLREGLRPGLLCLDPHRLAAHEQLRTYAEIINVPVALARTSDQVESAIGRLGTIDRLLIDTSGWGPGDIVQRSEQASLLHAAQADEVHLLLPAVSGLSPLRSVVEQFAPLAPNRLLLTKLDEARALGSLLAILAGDDRPVSFLSQGQNVPEDLELAQANRLARRILGWAESPSRPSLNSSMGSSE